jgi:ligand-binding sensor domain-containing protein
VFTDSHGQIWVGTTNGLAYYDNYTNSFHSFFQNSKDQNSLPSNWINVVSEDQRGVLWIGTLSGLCSFDLRNNRFKRFLHSDHSNSISSNEIRDIKFASDNSMWIGTSNGLNRLDFSTMRFTFFFHQPDDSFSLFGNSLGKMERDEKGGLWIIQNGTLYLDYFDTKTNRCKHFLNFVGNGTLIPSNYLRSIFLDKTGRIWLGTNAGGLVLFLPDENSSYEYKADPFDPNKLQSNSVLGMFQDYSGMIWLATTASAERFNPDESKFQHYLPPGDLSHVGITHKWIRAIVEDSLNRLWIGSLNGVYVFDRNTGKFENYRWQQDDPYSLSDNSVRSVCCDKQGNIWVGTANGLNLLDAAKNKFHVFHAGKDNHSLAGNFVTSIVCNKKGDLLIGTNAGLSVYHFTDHQFSNFKNDFSKALLNGEIRIIFEDSNGWVWIGTGRKGLIRYNFSTAEMQNFTNNVNDPHSLAANFVCSIAEDHKGVIWVGTESGLCRFNYNTENFTTFSERNGLPNVHVAQLLVDDRDRLWMSTNKGISVLDQPRLAFTNYDPSDGLQGWEFNDQSAFRTHDGYFCYCGKNGFNLFHPDSLKKNNFVPPLVLKRIKIFDQPLNMDSSFLVTRSLKLSYKQNFFSFEFAALNYDHPEKNQYACQLVNFDKKMVMLGTNRVITYTNVPPGHYTLKVMASNNDGVWNQAGYELTLTIIPPFWATWWFRLIVIMLLASAIFVVFKIRVNRIKKEQARQTEINKRIAEIRMTALRAQMNPHFIFNSLNAIQHFVTTREKEEALNYLSKFSKLIRKILENSRENSVTLGNELQLLELYIQLEQLRFNHKFDYQILVDEKIDLENMEIPPLLIQPFVENAILHGLINKEGRGNLRFCLNRFNGMLLCTIEDNGIGRLKAQQIEQKKISKHKSLGIKVTDERISNLSAVLDQKIEVKIEDLSEPNETSLEEQAAGTRVTISIPIKDEE